MNKIVKFSLVMVLALGGTLGAMQQGKGAGTGLIDKPSHPTMRLWAACVSGKLAEARKHIADGADVNASAPNASMTALHFAAKNGHLELVKMLIAEGADCTAETSDGKTVRKIALENKHKDIVKLFTKSRKKRSRNEVVEEVQPARVEQPKEAVQQVVTPPARSFKKVIFEKYQNQPAGKAPMYIESAGMQPMGYQEDEDSDVILYGSDDVFAIPVNFDSSSDDALQVASSSSSDKAQDNTPKVSQPSMEELRRKQIELEAQFEMLKEQIVKRPAVIDLLQDDAPRGTRGTRKIGGFDLTSKRKSDESIALVSSGTFCLPSNELYNAIFNEQIDRVERLLKDGVSANTRFSNDKTCLHIAAELGNLDLVKLLLKYHADYNAMTLDGKKARQLALDNGHNRVSIYLLNLAQTEKTADRDYVAFEDDGEEEYDNGGEGYYGRGSIEPKKAKKTRKGKKRAPRKKRVRAQENDVAEEPVVVVEQNNAEAIQPRPSKVPMRPRAEIAPMGNDEVIDLISYDSD